MANVTTELKVLVKAVGKGELKELEASLNKLAVTARTKVDVNFKKVSAELKKIQSTSTTSIRNLRDYRNAWRDIAAQLDISSKEFKEARTEAARLDAQLAKAEKRRPAGRGSRFASAAKGVGAIAGAGVFGGPEGAIGATIGLAGGLPGAIVGGAIGAQVGQLRKAAGATAEYAASLAKLRVALKGVTTDDKEYAKSLDLITNATKDFAIPQEILTKQFTKLQASVQGAGGDIDDTEIAFKGIVAAVRATGGSLQDVDSALTATAQVFSKGKVSAEELRQQIGERLPGAFSLFAASIGKTPQELDKALEQGKVSLQDFQTFSEALFERYGENAKMIASGPEAAGDRLKVVLGKLNENLGALLAPIGASFQETFIKIAEAINTAVKALDKFFGASDDARIAKNTVLIQAANKSLFEIRKRRAAMQKEIDEGGDLFGTRSNRIRDYDLDIASIEKERQRLRDEINARTRSSFDIQRPTAGAGLPGITPVLSGDSEKNSLAKIKDSSAEVLRLTQEMNAAKATGQLITAEQLRLELDIQSIAERFNANQIGFNEAARLSSIAIEASRKRGLKLREDEKNELAKLSVKQKEVKKELTETEKILISIKDTMATGLANAIEGLITGTQTLKESLAGILKQIGSMLLQFGMKQLIGSINFGGGASKGIAQAVGGFAANGAYFDRGVAKFASGGIVNSPTMFAYANGGAGRFGLMGEAGPEAIMPLKRGANGRLGVEVSGQNNPRAAMSRYSRSSRGSSVIPAEGGGAAGTEGGVAVAAPIDVRYNVERINSVDYVTADQFQDGMKRAAAEGAQRGQQLTLTRLQQSPATRRRIGM